MRKILFFISSGLIMGIMLLSGCPGNDPDPDNNLTDKQERVKELSGTWVHSNTIQLPSTVDPGILNNLTLTFNENPEHQPTTFSATGAPDFFNTTSSSTWDYSGSGFNIIELSNVSPVDVITVNSQTLNNLNITFNFTTVRVAGLDGTYVVELTK